MDYKKITEKARAEAKSTNDEGLIREYRETYLEPDAEPSEIEKHPYAYVCPVCGRFIANDEAYSVPPMCDECAKNS